ncbi:hypothetical protein KAFR_0D02960 [Kazachstania africana CBS 2517]|uniref:Uncharacterized protein n=1 Tax=Kazachstania africana (strain ATCC 22294 / BCRC 22015 / CBS 2517 / CECT 1963 / NBRC 1671 / NRRL Y-8276) TaxID=1071382 RepID=H2AU94_KAZAF|nr:hypothetical protein KAFR_0D02960 [Kazachstania africana CBS 2517]CCF57944.1 hypothetical protein KAFR_0D02960 [Kazachstania africana CBS 2517]
MFRVFKPRAYGRFVSSSVIKCGVPKPNWIVSASTIAIMGYGTWWYYYPHHKFPKTVANSLRYALWEEEKTKDFKKSLSFFVVALNECNKLNMDTLSDEYTGIEIKIAEMYEKLNLDQQAQDIYLSILEKLQGGIKSCTNITEKGRLLNKDLSILVKLCQKPNFISVNTKAAYLQYHINLAQDEIFESCSDLRTLMENTELPNIVASDKGSNLNKTIPNLSKYKAAIHPFKESFFVARDLLTEAYLNSNNTDRAIQSKMITIGWMILAGMPVGQVLLSQTNLASLLYMKSEDIEAELYKRRKDNVVIESAKEFGYET